MARIDGIKYCYEGNTGERIWTYEAVDPLNEILYSNNWPLRPVIITDEKTCLPSSKHYLNKLCPKPLELAQDAPSLALKLIPALSIVETKTA